MKWTQAQINRYQDTLDLEDGKVKTEEQITPTHTSIRISDCNRIRQNLQEKRRTSINLLQELGFTVFGWKEKINEKKNLFITVSIIL